MTRDVSRSHWMLPATPDPQGLRIAVKVFTKSVSRSDTSGDWHFATGLAQALNRLGHPVRLDPIDCWERTDEPPDVELALRGIPYPAKAQVPLLIWAIYPGRRRHDIRTEFPAARHVFFASRPDHERHRGNPGLRSSSFMPQAFDPGRMYPGEGARNGIVFVGSNYAERDERRPMIEWALAAEIDFRLWGRAWWGTPAERHLVDKYLPNEKLGDLYRSAAIVLCDHRFGMARQGYVSNRIFDALACGAPVISDPVDGLPDQFQPFIEVVSGPRQLRHAIARIQAEGPEKRAARLAFARSMIGRHDFDARAAEIVATARRVL